MKVTVLGATGFLGSWAARALIADGHEVRALVRPDSDSWRIDTIHGLEKQRLNAATWPAVLASDPPHTLLSLDWEGVAARERDDDDVQARNLSRQATLYAAALNGGTQRIVGTGSQAEFGPVDGPIDEDRDPSPQTAYGRAKVSAHAALADAAAAAGAEHVWARVFSVFGPLETGDWLLPKITTAGATGEPLSMSSATQPWSYLFAADAGRALAVLATNPAAAGTYNVAHPIAPPLRESAEPLATALGAELRFGEVAGAGLEPRVSRLLELGWEPLWASDRAFGETAAWFRGETLADPLIAGATLPTSLRR